MEFEKEKSTDLLELIKKIEEFKKYLEKETKDSLEKYNS